MQRHLIWDIPTRLFHWTLAGSFALAWLTSEGDEWRSIHVFLGYLMLGLVVFRLVWGLVGSHYSRFSSFWFGPREALEYLKLVFKKAAPRHVGHNPTGSLAIYILLALVTVTGLTGVLTLGGDEQQGLLAGWFSFSDAKLLKNLHELSANLMMLVVAGHITGVVVESWLHKENLARSMVHGYKLADADTPLARPHWPVAALMVLVILGYSVWWFSYAVDRNLAPESNKKTHVKFVGKALPDNVQWRDECGSCHGVFYPALLPARSWQKMMAEQDKHFGSDLGLDDATVKSVLAFLVDNAADKHQTEAAFKIDSSLAPEASPQRITETPYWIKKHREIGAADWANPLVKSKNNCAACHVDADAGTFEDAAMHIPAMQTPAQPSSTPARASSAP